MAAEGAAAESGLPFLGSLMSLISHGEGCPGHLASDRGAQAGWQGLQLAQPAKATSCGSSAGSSESRHAHDRAVMAGPCCPCAGEIRYEGLLYNIGELLGEGGGVCTGRCKGDERPRPPAVPRHARAS